MSGYIGPIPVPQGIQNKETFTATAGQTTFNTNGYTDGAFISVYLNGVRLVNGTDYTATNGSDFVLTQAASVSDVVDFESFNSFSLASQQFENITTKNPTHEDTDGGRESALSFQGEQSGGEISTLAAIQASHDGTADDQKGDLIFKTNDGSDNNAPTERLRIDSDGSIVPATLGTSNVKLGLNAGKAIASGGNYNTVIGEEAGAALSTGDVNTFVGYQSGDATTTSGNNVGVGYASLTTNILSSKNVAIGNNALKTHNLGSAGDGLNVAVGHGAGEEITTGTHNTLIGGLAGDAITDGTQNTAVGYTALGSNVSATQNTAVGYGSLASNTSGGPNTAVGRGSLNSNTTGSNNTGLGTNALNVNTTGTTNTAVGTSALQNNNSSEATAVGYQAAYSNTSGVNLTAIGKDALYANTSGHHNTAVGIACLDANTTGGSLTAMGVGALGASTTANHGTALGYSAGSAVTTGSYNTLMGSNCATATTTGGYNTFLGASAAGNAQTVAFSTIVGMSTLTGDTSSNNCNGLGYGITCVTGYTTLGITTSDIRAQHGVATWSTVSDERYKKDITDSTLGLSFISALKPRTFKYRNKGDLPETFRAYEEGSTEVYKFPETQLGFIAQEVKTAIDADSNVADGFKMWGERPDGSQEIAEAALIPVLVKAIQELSAKNDALEAQNTAIKARLDALEAE